MNYKNILFLVTLGMTLPASLRAESTMNTIDQKIAKVVGKNNVGTAKKVAAGIVITAVALPVLYFISRAALKPCLKYDVKTEQKYKYHFETQTGAAYVLKAGGTLTEDVTVPVRSEGMKSVCQTFFRISIKDPNNWKQQ